MKTAVIPPKNALTIPQIYKSLLKAFGPQGWWPVSAEKGRPPVYRGFHGPRRAAEMFEICAGAILTQNTAWRNVERALSALAAEGLLSPERIAGADNARLHRALRPSGYYRQKAGRLRDFCRYILEARPEGLPAWFSGDAARLREELLALRGVGPETADSMLLYAAGKPKFVIDAYTRRIFTRLGFPDRKEYAEWQRLFEGALPPDPGVFNEYHALIVALGKDHCKKTSPLCGGCPLKTSCAAQKATESKGKKKKATESNRRQQKATESNRRQQKATESKRRQQKVGKEMEKTFSRGVP